MNKKRNALSLIMLLLIGMISFPIASAQAIELEKEGIEQELTYTLEHSKVLYETSNEQIILMESSEGEIGYGVLKVDNLNPNRIYFYEFSQEEFNDILKINSNSLNQEISSETYISEEDAYVVLSSSSFGTGSYVEEYGNFLTGGYHVYFSARDAPIVVAGSILLLNLAALALVGLGATAPVSALMNVLGSAIGLYYAVAKNDDGSLDIKIPYIAMPLITSGIPGAAGYIFVGSIKYYFYR